MLTVTNLTGFGAKAVTAATVSSISQNASANVAGGSLTAPADINAGDLLVFFDTGVNIGAAPDASAVPSGFTEILTDSLGGSDDARMTLSYKIADGTEGSSSLTGMTHDFEVKLLYTYRGDIAISSVNIVDTDSEITDGNPTSQTIASGSGSAPLVVVAGYTSSGVVNPRTFSPAKDGEIGENDTAIEGSLAYKIYNSSPANVSIDMDDEGVSNGLCGCYIECS